MAEAGAAASISSGTGMSIFLPIHSEYTRPPTSHAGTPHSRPIRISQPRLTCNRPAATTGPGCGGRNACTIDRPASSGIANNTIDLPVRFVTTYTSGANTKMPTSKNTGMPKMRPERPIANGARFSPNSRNNRPVSTSAPPDDSSTAPISVPRPMINAIWPRMPPKPISSNDVELFCAVPTIFETGSPAASATTSPATSNAMNGSVFNRMIMYNNNAMPTTANSSKPAVECCNQCTNVMPSPGNANGSNGRAGSR